MLLATPALFLPQNLEDFENYWTKCPWEDDLKYARAVCDQVEVPLEVVHLTDEYWNNVVSYIIEEYRCGRTPNPDVLCNTRIKFGAFMDAIYSLDYDYIASGHYANVVHPSADQRTWFRTTICSVYVNVQVKDQTYFLSHLSQFQLKRLIFPLGCLSKDEVRQLATKFDLPNKDRKDSQGICFLGKIRLVILSVGTLGRWKDHGPGARYFRTLRLGKFHFSQPSALVSNHILVFSQWFSGSPPNYDGQLQCKVRHGSGFYNCSYEMVHVEDDKEDVAVVQLSEDDQGLAAGQFAAFYEGQTCIGSGVILESWDDQGFPVCAKALEIARMEDKSKLGKPVKIMTKPETLPEKSVHTQLTPSL
ncbi:GTPase Der-like [Hibiscus syriacus]|uniref:tRNA-5-taurinomethyluridine 2-sulfurtransferase n=1 Tax=Hibiscus syriacus TaxID=106335 RepID=A0A6A2WQV7_HIBSY|nr:GTPase Der-like [Hibiscus syriacus]